MSEIIRIPGRRDIRISTTFDVTDEDAPAVVSYSPDWVVGFYDSKSKALTKSNLTQDPLKECIELYGWTSEANHYASGALSNHRFSSASTQHGDLITVIPHGEHSPKLEDTLYKGSYLAKIIIIRCAFIEGKIQFLQRLEFKQARILRIQMNVEYSVIYTKIEQRKNEMHVYDHTGKSTGKKISTIDYQKVTAEAK